MKPRHEDPAAAWAPYEPDDQTPWTLPLVGHLHRRAGLGATWAELQEGLRLGPAKAVARLVRPAADTVAWNRTFDGNEAPLGPEDRSGFKAWWLRRMLTTPHPLLEWMTLFWHDHITAGGGAVGDVQLMAGYLRGLRTQALGELPALLHRVVDDPAVLLTYGAKASRRAQPAREFPRALLERFTLGPGVASAADLGETARAFTGRFVLRGEVRLFPRQHDDGSKALLGKKGNYGPKDVCDILLAHPATPRWIVRRLYRWLIAEDSKPSGRLLEPLVADFAKDLHLGRLVERMLRSRHFYAAASYRHRIKSPLELLLGIARSGETLLSTSRMARDLDALGQDLLHPPKGKGWPGGTHWINGGTWTGRCNRIHDLARGAGAYGTGLEPKALAVKHGRMGRDRRASFLIDLLVQGDLDAPTRKLLLSRHAVDRKENLRGLLYDLTTLPEFHLA